MLAANLDRVDGRQGLDVPNGDSNAGGISEACPMSAYRRGLERPTGACCAQRGCMVRFVSPLSRRHVNEINFGCGSCDTEASSAYRRRPTVRVMTEGPSG